MASETVAPRYEPLGDPAGGIEPTPLSAQRAAAGDVARDLEEIFGAAPAPAPDRPRARRARREAPPAPEPHGSRLAAMGGLAAAAFLGIAAGAFLMTDRAAAPARPAPRALPVEIAQARPAPTPGPLDPLAAASATATVAPAAAAAPLAAPVVGPVRAHAGPRRIVHACCVYAQMAAADRRLRAAYAGAVRAGAPRPLLVSYRDRWASIRRQGLHEPRRLVEGYGALAADLDRAAAQARAHPRRYADRRNWRPRYAPWWS